MQYLTNFLFISFCITFSFFNPQVSNAQFKIQLEQPTPEFSGLEHAVNKAVQAGIDNDSAALNKLIHPKIGLYIQYTIGAQYSFQHVVNFSAQDLPMSGSYWPFNFNPNEKQLVKKGLPKLICDSTVWSKAGWFYQPVESYLGKSYQQLYKHYGVISKKEATAFQRSVKSFDKNYVAVFFIDQYKQENILWYFKKTEGKWWLVIWDASFYCDA